jgi:hypothetical protein
LLLGLLTSRQALQAKIGWPVYNAALLELIDHGSFVTSAEIIYIQAHTKSISQRPARWQQLWRTAPTTSLTALAASPPTVPVRFTFQMHINLKE